MFPRSVFTHRQEEEDVAASSNLLSGKEKITSLARLLPFPGGKCQTKKERVRVCVCSYILRKREQVGLFSAFLMMPQIKRSLGSITHQKR